LVSAPTVVALKSSAAPGHAADEDPPIITIHRIVPLETSPGGTERTTELIKLFE
jgi:hypothetical protein